MRWLAVCAPLDSAGSGWHVATILSDGYEFDRCLRTFGVTRHDSGRDGDAAGFRRIAERVRDRAVVEKQ